MVVYHQNGQHRPGGGNALPQVGGAAQDHPHTQGASRSPRMEKDFQKPAVRLCWHRGQGSAAAAAAALRPWPAITAKVHRQPRIWHTAVPRALPQHRCHGKAAVYQEMARAVCSGAGDLLATSMATAVSVPDTSAATTRWHVPAIATLGSGKACRADSAGSCSDHRRPPRVAGGEHRYQLSHCRQRGVQPLPRVGLRGKPAPEKVFQQFSAVRMGALRIETVPLRRPVLHHCVEQQRQGLAALVCPGSGQ